MLRCLPFLLLATAVQAQHLRELDFQQIYAQSRVAVQEVYSYTCENNLPVDSCLISRTEYDQEGRMTMSTDYFACGRVFCEQTFTYDEEGKLATNTLRHRFNGMQEVEVELVRNADGHVVERVLSQPIPNFWMVERMERSDRGHVLAVQHFRKQAEGTEQFWQDQFLPLDVELEKRQTNTLTDVYDEQGLLLLHHSFGKQGLTRITKHLYTRHAG